MLRLGCVGLPSLLLLLILFPTAFAGPVLNYSSFLGGSGQDVCYDLCLDDNLVVVGGGTDSVDFPTMSSYQPELKSEPNGFISAFDWDGALIFSTYFGGTNSDLIRSLDLFQETILTTGYTSSTDLPMKDAIYWSLGGGEDVFISRFTTTGDLDFSTYLGGSGDDKAFGIAGDHGDSSGEFYALVGWTESTDLPISGHSPWRSSLSGTRDAFVARFNSETADTLDFLSYFGGDAKEDGNAVCLENTIISLAGNTNSENFPTVNPVQVSLGGGSDPDSFIARFDSDLDLIFSTYLGGGKSDTAYSIRSMDQELLLAGFTSSTDFPVVNAFQPKYGGGASDAFIAYLDSSQTLGVVTYVGGSGYDVATVTREMEDGAWLAGFTSSTDFPLANAFQSSYGGSIDAFVLAIGSDGNPTTSSYLGGSGQDGIYSLERSPHGCWMTGWTSSSSADFPVVNAFQSIYGGGNTDGWFGHLTYVIPGPIPGDYNGDGTSDLAIFRPSESLWIVRNQTRVYFGASADTPVPQDYDGDATWDLAFYRPSSTLWKVRGLTRFYFGTSSDIPIPRDYQGDGTAQAAIFRDTAALWKVRGRTRFYFGNSGDYLVPAYYGAAGRAEPAIFRPSLGLWKVRGWTRFYFGTSEVIPVPGDYNGDGFDDYAWFRPSVGLWRVRDQTNIYFGTSADIPIPGDFNGDKVWDPGFFRPGTTLWKVRDITRVYFGRSGDTEVTNPS